MINNYIKKYYYILFAIIFYINWVFADVNKLRLPDVWLPDLSKKDEILWGLLKIERIWWENALWFITVIITEAIKFTWVLAIIALIIWWIMYITSMWADEKIKKAKDIIIYSLVWVVLSISAYAIVSIVNNLSL